MIKFLKAVTLIVIVVSGVKYVVNKITKKELEYDRVVDNDASYPVFL